MALTLTVLRASGSEKEKPASPRLFRVGVRLYKGQDVFVLQKTAFCAENPAIGGFFLFSGSFFPFPQFCGGNPAATKNKDLVKITCNFFVKSETFLLKIPAT